MSDRQFDKAVNDWLESGSDRTPPAAIDAVLLAVKTTPQERGLRSPRRFIEMTFPMRLAAAIAIVAVLGVGAFTFLVRNPDSGVGGPPTASPTLAPTSAPSGFVTPSSTPPSTTGWLPFSSNHYGYTIAYPPTWVATQATRDWVLASDRLASPAPGGPLDVLLGSPNGIETAVFGFAEDIPAGTSEDAWLASYYAGGAFCPTMPTFVPITVDGHAGRLDPCFDAQAFVFVGNRVYVFVIYQTQMQPLFRAFLSTVRFPASPAPS
jgi:hypothetical protein